MKQYFEPNRGHGPNPSPTWTVAELIGQLSQYPPDMPVVTGFEGMIGAFGGKYGEKLTVCEGNGLIGPTLVIGEPV